MEVINWNLLKHPFNWVTVVLMVVIGGMFLTFLFAHVSQQAQSTQ